MINDNFMHCIPTKCAAQCYNATVFPLYYASVPTVPVLYISSAALLKRDNVPGINGRCSDPCNFARMSY